MYKPHVQLIDGIWCVLTHRRGTVLMKVSTIKQAMSMAQACYVKPNHPLLD